MVQSVENKADVTTEMNGAKWQIGYGVRQAYLLYNMRLKSSPTKAGQGKQFIDPEVCICSVLLCCASCRRERCITGTVMRCEEQPSARKAHNTLEKCAMQSRCEKQGRKGPLSPVFILQGWTETASGHGIAVSANARSRLQKLQDLRDFEHFTQLRDSQRLPGMRHKPSVRCQESATHQLRQGYVTGAYGSYFPRAR